MTNQSQVVRFTSKHPVPSLNRKTNKKEQQGAGEIQVGFQGQAEHSAREARPPRLFPAVHFPSEPGAEGAEPQVQGHVNQDPSPGLLTQSPGLFGVEEPSLNTP